MPVTSAKGGHPFLRVVSAPSLLRTYSVPSPGGPLLQGQPPRQPSQPRPSGLHASCSQGRGDLGYGCPIIPFLAHTLSFSWLSWAAPPARLLPPESPTDRQVHRSESSVQPHSLGHTPNSPQISRPTPHFLLGRQPGIGLPRREQGVLLPR